MGLDVGKSWSGGFIIFDISYKKIDDITPFWRVVSPSSKLAGKLNFGIDFITENQIKEHIAL